jgi:hypothetical protein
VVPAWPGKNVRVRSVKDLLLLAAALAIVGFVIRRSWSAFGERWPFRTLRLVRIPTERDQ